MRSNERVFLAIFESKSKEGIDKILNQVKTLGGVNFMTYVIDDDKLKMIFAALEASRGG